MACQEPPDPDRRSALERLTEYCKRYSMIIDIVVLIDEKQR